MRFRPGVVRISRSATALFVLVLVLHIFMGGEGALSCMVGCSGAVALFWFAVLLAWTENKLRLPRDKPAPPAGI